VRFSGACDDETDRRSGQDAGHFHIQTIHASHPCFSAEKVGSNPKQTGCLRRLPKSDIRWVHVMVLI
jgi:hypothetical protein